MQTSTGKGPLAGLRVLEFEAIGPVPFCGMMLADMGADVLLLDRPVDAQLGVVRERRFDSLLRGRRSLAVDLKTDAGRQAALALAAKADVLIEGYRPGVLERLGLDPALLLETNPRLVIGRMTGWGQQGPLAQRAGHDINFIAMSGALHAMGRPHQAPAPPLNLVGDFGGGGMMLAFGLACAVISARATGKGQVVDAAMIDGAGSLCTMFAGMLAAGSWSEQRGANLLDGGAPWYDCYRARDGKFVAVGAIEARFYQQLLEGLGLDGEDLPGQHDRNGWPRLRARFAEVFAQRSRDEWASVFEGRDACVSPVLSFNEAMQHPLSTSRTAWMEVNGVPQPAPAPRFSATPGSVRNGPPERGEGAAQALADWGFDADEQQALLAALSSSAA